HDAELVPAISRLGGGPAADLLAYCAQADAEREPGAVGPGPQAVGVAGEGPEHAPGDAGMLVQPFQAEAGRAEGVPDIAERVHALDGAAVREMRALVHIVGWIIEDERRRPEIGDEPGGAALIFCGAGEVVENQRDGMAIGEVERTAGANEVRSDACPGVDVRQ